MPRTPPTQMRLTVEDKAMVEFLRVRYGLPTATAAVRLAIEELYSRSGHFPNPLFSAGSGQKKGP